MDQRYESVLKILKRYKFGKIILSNDSIALSEPIEPKYMANVLIIVAHTIPESPIKSYDVLAFQALNKFLTSDAHVFIPNIKKPYAFIGNGESVLNITMLKLLSPFFGKESCYSYIFQKAGDKIFYLGLCKGFVTSEKLLKYVEDKVDKLKVVSLSFVKSNFL
ncbi:MAG TPA: hypothetical protein ENG42_01005 [Candidatus Aenigmarchaeota archaeon]|nr:hypothetical protein [Candidatus Aenigmarchaeota archaeon]